MTRDVAAAPVPTGPYVMPRGGKRGERVRESSIMAHRFPEHLRVITPTLVRGLWAVMLLLHAPALLKAWKASLASGLSLAQLDGCIALSIATLFFVLKLMGVRWLRFRPGRQSAIAIVLAIGLIHIDCIRPELDGTLAGNCTVVLATTTLVAGLTQLPQAIGSYLTRRMAAVCPRAPRGRSGETVWLDVDHPRCWVLSKHLFLLRAPPCCC